MSQISLLFDDSLPAPAESDSQAMIIKAVEPEPVPASHGYNMTETSMPWRAFVGGRWTPYEAAAHPTDPVRFSSHCPHCRASFALTVPLSDLDPDVIYCLELGGAWSPKDLLPCWTCALRIVEFLTKLLA